MKKGIVFKTLKRGIIEQVEKVNDVVAKDNYTGEDVESIKECASNIVTLVEFVEKELNEEDEDDSDSDAEDDEEQEKDDSGGKDEIAGEDTEEDVEDKIEDVASEETEEQDEESEDNTLEDVEAEIEDVASEDINEGVEDDSEYRNNGGKTTDVVIEAENAVVLRNSDNVSDKDIHIQEEYNTEEIIDLLDEDENVHYAKAFNECMIEHRILRVNIDKWEFDMSNVEFSDIVLSILEWGSEGREERYKEIAKQIDMRGMMKQIFANPDAEPSKLRFNRSVSERVIYKMLFAMIKRLGFKDMMITQEM